MRIDRLLVARGFFDTRARARAAIEAGRVKADGRMVAKPAEKIGEDAVIQAEAAHPWVGRGALKLERALELWPVGVEGRMVLDVGASTGGFTEVCLARGAARVFAVDVGTGQLHPRVAADPRVVNLEQTDARALTSVIISEAPSLIVCDVSFISLLKVLPAALDLAPSGADLITLVKPQFEADGPKAVGRKGVVKDPEAHAAAVARVREWLQLCGWAVREIADSPITGGDGNIEFLLWAQKA